MAQFIDCKDNAIMKENHGSRRATSFIYFIEAMSSVAYVSNVINIVNYLHYFMYMDVASSSTTVTNFLGMTCAFSLLGGFLSDSYISRFKVILIFTPLEFLVILVIFWFSYPRMTHKISFLHITPCTSLSIVVLFCLPNKGFGLLALQAHLPSLRPPKCNTSMEWSDCKHVHGYNAAILYIAMYSIALGEGFLRANLASLGGDQFDDDTSTGTQMKSSFFNWFSLSLSAGALTGLLFIVWVEDNRGWDIGFAVTAGVFLLGLLVFACGFSFYRHQIPRGSPLTRILQVLVAAFRNRNLQVPENADELYQEKGKDIGRDVLLHTESMKCLDKASVFSGNDGKWFLCNVTQVEETKIVVEMLPIFVSAMIGYIPIPQLSILTIQQGGTMNTKLGTLDVSPASLMVIPVSMQVVILVIYERFFVPLARRITGYQTGITHLQRIGVGFLAASLTTAIGAVIEMKRKSVAKEHGLLDSGEQVPMSVMWLALQFFGVSIIHPFTFVGMLEFFNTEASVGMKSLGTAISWCVIGSASLLGSLLVDVVNNVTSDAGKIGWLEGNNLNRNYLDRFYWFLSVLGFVGFLNYLYWARRYTCRKHNLVDLRC